MKKLLISILILSFIASSCGVQKRRYNKGYDISFRKISPKTSKHKVDSENTSSNYEGGDYCVTEQDDDLMASANQNTIADVVSKSKKRLITPSNDSCDIIYLKNHQIIKAKVIEINKSEIKYKRCDNLSGPLIVIEKNEVKNITYKNGYNEEFNATEANNPPNRNTAAYPKKKERSNLSEYDGFAIASLVCGILAPILLFTAIPAVVCGIIGLRNIRESGNTIKGRIMATIGLVIGITIIILFFLVLMALLGTI